MDKKVEKENFRGRSADAIEAIIKLQYALERVSTLQDAKRICTEAIQANVFPIVLGNALQQAKKADDRGDIRAASAWHQLHHTQAFDEGDGRAEDSPLRGFVVKYGLVQEAEQYFAKILTVDEWRAIGRYLSMQSESHENHLFDAITAFRRCGDTDGLESTIKQVVRSGRLDLAEKAAEAIPRSLTQDEARQLASCHFDKIAGDSYVEYLIKIIQKYKLDDLCEKLMDEVAKHHGEEYTRAAAKKLGVELTVKQLGALYMRHVQNPDIDQVIKLAQELARKSDEWKRQLPDVYKLAKAAAIKNDEPLITIERYAQEAGAPLTIEELLNYWRGGRRGGEPKHPQDVRTALKRASKMLYERDNPK